ncbi:TPA: hypothetical protein NI644_001937 [Pseudomonas aeruginosa]|uniref:hypothetical protein n=1 Tax=Pseudomonas aeruginosa TaxID=287 RepID=UPI000D434503|nr:hypothetical protein [Pseudomonas aeruginosa]MBI7359244.1 hypothetical protein [Pseudomonas aeruginosa]PRW29689.1 hypothetical protein CSB96_6721 [Pseudomonas aeruginosa]PRW30866.1 hypothetical protein CSB96_0039 [Pseudomonas aeruginosa]HCF9264891.1 hypothetical protein [Pseudomonas aeruginosa]HCF9271011.1 hypothetical protein [Pseudomonas aeruginosa]
MNKALDLLREIRPSIPKEVLELWCKDRDAFIASHPAAEQAGGDERAAFEAAFAAMGRPVCRADYDQDAYGTPFDDGGWTGWQARAALAQPYPKSGDYSDQSWINAGCPPEQPEQAEAERPEVAAWQYRVTAGPQTGWSLWHPGKGEEFERSYTVERRPLMTVAQHERIVGELRADRDSWAEQAEQRLADWDEMRKERDAALARVAELEKQEPVALANRGNQAFWVKWTEAAAGLYGPGIKLYAAPVAQAQQLNDLDKQCRDDVARALGLRPNQERGFAWSYLLASIKSCVKASGDSAQAQHSVPGNAAALVRAEAKKYSLNAAGMLDSGAPEHAQTFAIVQLLSEFDDEEAESHWEAIMAYSDFRTSDALFRAAELLAAAPGKEGV